MFAFGSICAPRDVFHGLLPRTVCAGDSAQAWRRTTFWRRVDRFAMPVVESGQAPIYIWK
jgi:hypothetical protein